MKKNIGRIICATLVLVMGLSSASAMAAEYTVPSDDSLRRIMIPDDSQTPAEGSAAASSDTEYTVQPGDSLWKIARKKLGSGARWSEIYEANRSVIQNPRLIYPGQLIVLPGEAQISLESYAYALAVGESTEQGTWWTLAVDGTVGEYLISSGLDPEETKSQICVLVPREDGSYDALRLNDYDKTSPPTDPSQPQDQKMSGITEVAEDHFANKFSTCYYVPGCPVYDVTGDTVTSGTVAVGDVVHAQVYVEDGKMYALGVYIIEHDAQLPEAGAGNNEEAQISLESYAYALAVGESTEQGTWWTLAVDGTVGEYLISSGLDPEETKSQICVLVPREDGSYDALRLNDYDKTSPPTDPSQPQDQKMSGITEVAEDHFANKFSACYYVPGCPVYDVTGDTVTSGTVAVGDVVHAQVYVEDGKMYALGVYIIEHDAQLPEAGAGNN